MAARRTALGGYAARLVTEYANSNDSTGETKDTIADFLKYIRTGDVKLKKVRDTFLNEQIKKIRIIVKDGLREGLPHEIINGKINPLKKQLIAVTWSGVFHIRKKEAIKEHTEILCADIDELDETVIPKLREKLETQPHILAVFLSPKGLGLKVLVPVSGIKQWIGDGELKQPEYAVAANAFHTSAFLVVEKYFKDEFGIEIDKACKDSTRLCYLSHDPALYVNWDAESLPVERPIAASEEATAAEPPRTTAQPKPYKPKKKKPPQDDTGDTGEKAKARKASVKTVESALEVIDPSTLEYQQWRNVGFALHDWSDGEDEGFEIWDRWSQLDEARYNDQEMRQMWDAMNSDRQDGITIGTVLKLAVDEGWQGGNGKPNVSFYADKLEKLLPQIICVGSTWYVGDNGTLAPRVKDQFRPKAQEILLSSQETSRLAKEVLNTVEGRRQVPARQLRPFAIMDGDQTVLLNCGNGILKVTPDNALLMPHNLEYMFTRQIAAAYNPDARCDVFERVVAEALVDEQDRELFLSFSGYVLQPNCKLHAALICHGLGGTGKSTVWEAVSSVMGTDLVLNVSLRQLCAGNGYSVPRLRFAALNVGTEAPSGELAESDMLKMLVCGEPVEARAIYGRPEKLEGYSVKFVFLSNHLPRFKSGTDAELRRLRFLQFDRKPDKIDPLLAHKLAAEKDGIFSNIMVPCLRGLLATPVIPEGGEASKAAKARFALENDPMESFLAECCVLGADVHEPKDRLHRAFVAWARDKDVALGLQTSEHFFRHLRSRRTGLGDYRPKVDGERRHCLRGVRLKEGVPLVEEYELDEVGRRRRGGRIKEDMV